MLKIISTPIIMSRVLAMWVIIIMKMI